MFCFSSTNWTRGKINKVIKNFCAYCENHQLTSIHLFHIFNMYNLLDL